MPPEREKAQVVRLPPRRRTHRKSKRARQEDIDLHDPNDTIPLENFNFPLRQWSDPSLFRLPAGQNSGTHSPAAYDLARPRRRPLSVFVSWASLDQIGKTIILKEISDHLGSFQAACQLLSLEANEIEGFLDNHQHARNLTVRWRQLVARWDRDGQLPHRNDEANGAGIKLITPECVAQACEFLGFMGLEQYSSLVNAWGNVKFHWPPNIDSSDFNPMELHQSRLDFPQSRPGLEDRQPAAKPASPDVENGMMAFRAPHHVNDDNISEVRIHYIVLPRGTVVVGPLGWKQLPFGGKYKILYPGVIPGQSAQASEFVIAATSIKGAPTKGNAKENHPQHVEHASSDLARREHVNNHDNQKITLVNHGVGVNSRMGGYSAATDRAKPIFNNALSNDHRTIQDAASHDLSFPQRSTPIKQVSVAPSLQDQYPRGREAFIELVKRTPKSASEPPEAHHASKQEDPTFMSNLLNDIKQLEDPKVADQRFIDLISMGIDMEDPEVRWEDLIISQAREEEIEWMLNNPRILSLMAPTGLIVNPADIFTDPDQLDGTRLGHLAEDAFYEYPEPKPRERTGVDHELAEIGKLLNGVICQANLPFGYTAKAPSGCIVNFDTHHNGPIDGHCPPGSGGQYTFMLPQFFFKNPRVQSHALPENVMFRVYIAEDMPILRDRGILPHTLDSGCFHQLSATNGEMDIVSEYGPYRIFDHQPLRRKTAHIVRDDNSENYDEDIVNGDTDIEDDTGDDDDGDYMESDSDYAHNDFQVNEDDNMNLDSEQNFDAYSGNQENKAGNINIGTGRGEVPGVPQDNKPEYIDNGAKQESKADTAPPLREAAKVLSPYRSALTQEEIDEQVEDLKRAQEAEDEIIKQFQRDQRESESENQRMQELESQQSAQAQTDATGESTGRKQRRRKRSTQNEELGLVEYSVAGFELENPDDQEDWLPPRKRRRLTRTRSNRRRRQSAAPAAAQDPGADARPANQAAVSQPPAAPPQAATGKQRTQRKRKPKTAPQQAAGATSTEASDERPLQKPRQQRPGIQIAARNSANNLPLEPAVSQSLQPDEGSLGTPVHSPEPAAAPAGGINVSLVDAMRRIATSLRDRTRQVTRAAMPSYTPPQAPPSSPENGTRDKSNAL